MLRDARWRGAVGARWGVLGVSLWRPVGGLVCRLAAWSAAHWGLVGGLARGSLNGSLKGSLLGLVGARWGFPFPTVCKECFASLLLLLYCPFVAPSSKGYSNHSVKVFLIVVADGSMESAWRLITGHRLHVSVLFNGRQRLFLNTCPRRCCISFQPTQQRHESLE